MMYTDVTLGYLPAYRECPVHAQVFLLLHLCVCQFTFIPNACGLVQEIMENVYDKYLQDFILNTYLQLLKTQTQTKCLFSRLTHTEHAS